MKIDLEAVRKYQSLDLLARQLVEGFITGMHKSPYHGFSVEFAEHKRYNPGESTRYIDWKAYAKTDKLYVKRFDEETNLRCRIILDNSSSMYYPVENYGKITFASVAAAALTYILHKQRDAVGLTTFSDKIDWQSAVRSKASHIQLIFQHLDSILHSQKENAKSSVASVLHDIASSMHQRSLVVIFSDMFENIKDEKELFNGLQHLKHKKHEILLFHVTDHLKELQFDFPDRPHTFVDLETGQKIKAHPSEVKQAYLKKIEERYARVKEKCAQYKVDYIEADINKDMEQVLLPYIIKRKRMR